MKTDVGVSSNQRSRARAMRGAPTDVELRLWLLLRDGRLNGFKFRRQVPVGPYIVDFLCVGAKLIVEADGSQHAESLRDNIRDAYLASQGWTVLRFWNNEVVQNRRCAGDNSGACKQTLIRLRATFSPREKGPAATLLPRGEGMYRTSGPEPLLPRGEGGAPKAWRMRANQ
jgi:very-short-patch-repair endonuclease